MARKSQGSPQAARSGAFITGAARAYG